MWGADAALTDAAVGQVLLLGDIHNNRRMLEAALRTAGHEGCDVSVQVGYCRLQDANWCGFAPARPAAMCAVVNAEIPVVVVDGNHEMWPSLMASQQRHDTAAARAAVQPLHLGGSLWRADRGSTWSCPRRRFVARGSSASPDRWIPSVAPWRWEQQTTTGEDLVRSLGNTADGLDVLTCHHAPDRTPGLASGLRRHMPPHLQPEADTVQVLLRAAVGATGPELVIHGQWHQHNRRRLSNGSEVVGPATDGHPQSAAVVTNPTLTDPTHRPPPAARASRPPRRLSVGSARASRRARASRPPRRLSVGSARASRRSGG
ncbi:MAG: hypothetical protein OXC00_00230, partial [Acidimicrobiaceae bacterium]|nr:hypothetical protein [Acidimicrobiaceae bacterium]